MCGISGPVNCGDKETLTRMTSVQAHRGRDDSGLREQRLPDGSYVGLGSRRLAIIDLSASGHMPMCNEDRTVVELWMQTFLDGSAKRIAADLTCVPQATA